MITTLDNPRFLRDALGWEWSWIEDLRSDTVRIERMGLWLVADRTAITRCWEAAEIGLLAAALWRAVALGWTGRIEAEYTRGEVVPGRRTSTLKLVHPGGWYRLHDDGSDETFTRNGGPPEEDGYSLNGVDVTDRPRDCAGEVAARLGDRHPATWAIRFARAAHGLAAEIPTTLDLNGLAWMTGHGLWRGAHGWGCEVGTDAWLSLLWPSPGDGPGWRFATPDGVEEAASEGEAAERFAAAWRRA